ELTFLGEYGIIIYAMKLGNAQFAKPPFAFAGGGLVHQRASEIPEVPGRLSRRNTKYRGERIPMDKPFLTLDEQVNRLKSRGLLVDTRTRWILEREGYYSVVNGYKWPFLDEGESAKAGDDRYKRGVSFHDIYRLFSFDRKLRHLVFEYTTLAEATLKTVVAYRFSAEHRDEVNPYLNPDNYAADKSESAGTLIQILQKIIKAPAHGRQEGRNRSDEQSYLSHYQENHGGEIPLWVLTNAMTLGQTFWLYQCAPAKVRGAIAESYENLYADSHRHRLPEKTISVKRLDAIYQRMRQFRNICAHDERLYCAHPHDRNATVWQLIHDFMLVVDKKRYQEFLQRVRSLVRDLRKDLSGYWDAIVREMGFTDFESEMSAYMSKIEKL
ncbi:Abi family protein, partial [Bifidobacterium merycicum]|uniref:Abi family protein n=1 Tax=Bifidobacterium merycicum TaxID=78345 RepID=UPI001F2D9AD1